MNEGANEPAGGVVDRRRPKRQRHSLSELVAIVRPPGNPHGVRAFAADELEEAAQYAAESGVPVVIARKTTHMAGPAAMVL